jgi:homoserine O-acetyltransferase
MGGMAVMEWPLCFPGFVQHIVVLATSARHSAWCISWGEAQRQSIYSDPVYNGGWYDVKQQPAQGLAAARMAALLTYRSRDSFEARFGRKAQKGISSRKEGNGVPTPPRSPQHSAPPTPSTEGGPEGFPGHPQRTASTLSFRGASPPRTFSAQSYLRYQGDKFTARFDANCYVHLTRKLDSHDLGRSHELLSSSHGEAEDEEEDDPVARDRALIDALGRLPPRALIMGVQSDGLFTISEQRFIASHVPDAELVVIPSPEGHDGFLLEFELINSQILRFLQRELPAYYAPGVGANPKAHVQLEDFAIKKTSVFGEAEVDITQW